MLSDDICIPSSRDNTVCMIFIVISSNRECYFLHFVLEQKTKLTEKHLSLAQIWNWKWETQETKEKVGTMIHTVFVFWTISNNLSWALYSAMNFYGMICGWSDSVNRARTSLFCPLADESSIRRACIHLINTVYESDSLFVSTHDKQKRIRRHTRAHADRVREGDMTKYTIVAIHMDSMSGYENWKSRDVI